MISALRDSDSPRQFRHDLLRHRALLEIHATKDILARSHEHMAAGSMGGYNFYLD